ncbi:hypothetical protein [Ruegeria lacuscaerulensis]|uniref:hypothetical protein n=1 Tax=Ruegeria lacuscaerulensis TaxID=55218 RepID=UPI00147A556F|nr:hypothetical protein [Ruegeria lacuscaerulensis]
MLSSSSPFPDVSDAASGLLVLTNGAQQFTATLISGAGESGPLLVFENECPARDQEFWISAFTETELQSGEAAQTDDTVIVFPPKPRMDNRLASPERRSVAYAGRRGD